MFYRVIEVLENNEQGEQRKVMLDVQDENGSWIRVFDKTIPSCENPEWFAKQLADNIRAICKGLDEKRCRIVSIK